MRGIDGATASTSSSARAREGGRGGPTEQQPVIY